MKKMEIITRKAMLAASIALMALTSGMLTACSSDDDINDVAPSAVDTKEWTLDTNMDTSYKPGDNFFMYSIGKYWNSTTLESANTAKGFMYNEVEELNNNRIAQIEDARITRIAQDFAKMEDDTLAALAIQQEYMKSLDAITTRDEALSAFATAMGNGVDLQLTFEPSMTDGKGSVIIQMGNSSSSDSEVEALLGKAGYSSARAKAVAGDYRSAMAKLTKGGVAEPLTWKILKTIPEKNDLVIPLKSMSTRSTGYSTLDKIVELLGWPEECVTVNKDQTSNYEQFENLTTDELKSLLAAAYSQDLMFISQSNIDTYNQTNPSMPVSKDDVMSGVETNYMGYLISYAYATKYVTEDMKTRGIATCKELQAVLRERIQALEWMSETTKQKALLKVDNMIINVGYPDKWIEEGFATLDGSSFYGDVIALRKAKVDLLKYCLGKDRNEVSFTMIFGLDSEMNLTITNACYDPYSNSINIFPVFLMDPLYKENASDAYNYAMYTVIGHEMTHGFDDNGVQYDEVGNHTNWWTEADKTAFDERLQTLVTNYNSLELLPDELPGVYADGKNTLGENVADLGGLLTTYSAYMKKLNSEGYYGDELTKQEKKFFQAYTELWRAKYDGAYAENEKREDVHSLPKERINGVVRNIDRWYELYDVQSSDKLYLAPEKRSYIW